MDKVEILIKKIGARIVAVREEQGISQAELSKRADIDDGSLRRIETGRTNPTIKTLHTIAEALEVEVSDLITS
jgi:transcriptional regulator with XRE-family HTH domain